MTRSSLLSPDPSLRSASETTPSPDEPGVFRQPGAWRIDLARLSWHVGLDAERARTRAEVPRLVTPRRIPPLLRFAEAGSRIGTALLGWSLRERRRSGSVSRGGLSRRLRRAFERLGPSYIKLGQILSSGRGLFPEELVEEFKRCRDQVPPEPFHEIERVLRRELGRPIDEVFARFEKRPLAAASIAQVHAATLVTGEEVVVKLQRPRVAGRVREDIAAMAWIAPWLVGRIPVAALANPPALVELFAETIVEELDFRLEAENMLDIARVLREAGQSTLVVPRPHPDLVTRRMLVMERLEGFRYENVEGMRAAGIDPAEVVRSLLIAFLEGAILFGVFHGDLHGGNLFVMPDGRVALFDYGMTGRLDEAERRAFLRLMMCGAVNDVRGQLVAFRDLGALAPDADLEALITLLGIDQPVKDPTKMAGDELVTGIQHVLRGLLRQGARLPKPLMLYVKGMLFFDGAISQMAPDSNVFDEMGKVFRHFATHHAARITRDIGFDPSQVVLDLAGVKASMGLGADVETITPRELQRRREQIRDRIEEAGGLPLQTGSGA